MIKKISIIIILFVPFNCYLLKANNVLKPNTLDEQLTGVWLLSDFEDDLERSVEEKTIFDKEIEALKQNFSFLLNSDFTYSRDGYTILYEMGSWKTVKKRGKNYLELSDDNGFDSELIKIVEIEENMMVLSYKTKFNKSKIISTLTLKRSEVKPHLFLQNIVPYLSNKEIYTSNNMNIKLLGSWGLSDYEDNIERNEEEIIDFENQIVTIKQNFALTFYRNLSFERKGFSINPEYGNWKIYKEDDELILELVPIGYPNGDKLIINELTDSKLILSITTINGEDESITKLILFKK